MSLKNPDVEILAHEFQIVENLFGYFKIINQWRMTFIPGLWISLVDIMYSEPCAKNSYSFEVWLGRQNASFPKWPIRSNRKRGCAVVRMRWSKHVNRTWKTVKKNEYQICIDWNSRRWPSANLSWISPRPASFPLPFHHSPCSLYNYIWNATLTETDWKQDFITKFIMPCNSIHFLNSSFICLPVWGSWNLLQQIYHL